MEEQAEINLVDAASDLQPVVVQGEVLTELPEDLYIPPGALRIFLEAFTGPMDLLCYLIKKQNINVLDIPMAKITEQYVKYVEIMNHLDIELASEYLVMAAMLAEIKSRMLLPSSSIIEADEEDPRAELVRRLREYEIFKKAASDIADLPQVDRDIFIINIDFEPDRTLNKPQPDVSLDALFNAMTNVLNRMKLNEVHEIQSEPLSIRERMTIILDKVHMNSIVGFSELFVVEEGRAGVVVTFIAILELLRQSMIDMVQSKPFAQIHLKAVE